MTLVEIVALVVSVAASVTKLIGLNKDFWAKVPFLAHYLPGATVALTVLGEKLMGVQTQSDLVNALVALGLLVYGHFSKPAAPAAPPAA